MLPQQDMLTFAEVKGFGQAMPLSPFPLPISEVALGI